MKDSELRAVVLKEFYDRRRSGTLGVNIRGPIPIELPTIELVDLLAICDQLGEYGLIEWRGVKDNSGLTIAGAGKISALGIDIIDGERKSPLPIHIDQSTHTQHITISGQHGGVQVAGANSVQTQNISQDFQRLIQAIEDSPATETQKKEAKNIVENLLNSAAITAVLGPAAQALIQKYFGA